jgi:hypothetical protein
MWLLRRKPFLLFLSTVYGTRGLAYVRKVSALPLSYIPTSLVFWDGTLICSSSWPQTPSTSTFKCWDYRCTPLTQSFEKHFITSKISSFLFPVVEIKVYCRSLIHHNFTRALHSRPWTHFYRGLVFIDLCWGGHQLDIISHTQLLASWNIYQTSFRRMLGIKWRKTPQLPSCPFWLSPALLSILLPYGKC